MDDTVEAIRGELKRLKATELDVGRVDEIRVRDDGAGYATLKSSPRKDPDSTGSARPPKYTSAWPVFQTGAARRRSAPRSRCNNGEDVGE
jgi:hypothetical protein